MAAKEITFHTHQYIKLSDVYLDITTISKVRDPCRRVRMTETFYDICPSSMFTGMFITTWFQTSRYCRAELNSEIMNTYLLLAEFSVRTVNYGPSFFPSMEKNENP